MDINPKLLRRAEALLAKTSERGCTPEEAESAYAAALALMERHSITDAMLRKAGQGSDSDQTTSPHGNGITRMTFSITDQLERHWRARCDMVWAIVHAYGASAILLTARSQNGTKPAMIIYATEAKIAMLKFILPLLVLQANKVGAAATQQYKRQNQTAWNIQHFTAARQGQLLREYFHGVLVGFGEGVATKIKRATGQLIEEAGSGAEIVLADDAQRARDALNAAFPDAVAAEQIRTGRAGRQTGREAGTVADIGQTRINGGRRAING